MILSNYTFHADQHKGKDVILVQFPFNNNLKLALKKRFPSARWSASKKAWYLPDLSVIRKELQLQEKNTVETKALRIHEVNQEAYRALNEQLTLKDYGKSTITMYLAEFYHLLVLLDDYPVQDLNPKRLKDYFLYCIRVEKMRERKLNGKINAIKFYFEQVLHRPKMFFDIPRPKKATSLPKMLSKSEVKKLFNVTQNIKHRIALQLCYGMGLRVSEVVNLKIEDIDSKRMVVHVVGAKGKKDRYVPLPKSILPKLREYYLSFKPKTYLFEGQYGGPYGKSSLQQVFRLAMKRAKINKKIGIHGLRHSYATHLLEAGADMRFIQELLGHHSIKTTQVYTKVTPRSISKVQSPLDSI
ncbi:tyrosine-type recombinase/integrase [Maribacter sp. R77961]|uniref:tyrosine-type recombinase/integrase n=1 Tax=Maribacter sp. R77961 TaxID=3093871 RepID=UPI0037C6ACFA